MTDAAEAKLLVLIEAALQLDVEITTKDELREWDQAKERLKKLAAPGLAAAVDLARALRDQGSELEGNWWHLRNCIAAYDWVHYHEVSECDLACHEAQEALARWDEVLAEQSDA